MDDFKIRYERRQQGYDHHFPPMNDAPTDKVIADIVMKGLNQAIYRDEQEKQQKEEQAYLERKQAYLERKQAKEQRHVNELQAFLGPEYYTFTCGTPYDCDTAREIREEIEFERNEREEEREEEYRQIEEEEERLEREEEDIIRARTDENSVVFDPQFDADAYREQRVEEYEISYYSGPSYEYGTEAYYRKQDEIQRERNQMWTNYIKNRKVKWP